MFQVGSLCYYSGAAAAAASASESIGSVVHHGGALYVLDVSGVTDSSITYTLNPVAGGSSVSYSSSYTPQPCGLLTSSDALSMAWMVVAAWVAAWSIMFLARIIRDWDKGGSDDS